jgi:hypothetical protein
MPNNYSSLEEDSVNWANSYVDSIHRMAANSGGTADQLVAGIQKKLGAREILNAEEYIQRLREEADSDDGREEITHEKVDKIEQSLSNYESNSRFTADQVISKLVPDDTDMDNREEVQQALSDIMFVNRQKWKSRWQGSFGF